jgi:hypothetical protein
MAQHPKFIISNNKGVITWRCEKENKEVTGTSGEEEFQDKGWAEESIKDHIRAVIGASGVSVTIDMPEFNPSIEFEGFEEDLPEPGPDDVTSEETVEEPSE